MNAFANIKTITKRELAAYFSSPLAYVFIVIFLPSAAFSHSSSEAFSKSIRPRSSVRSSSGTLGSICSSCPPLA